jgi:hypothetical protein
MAVSYEYFPANVVDEVQCLIVSADASGEYQKYMLDAFEVLDREQICRFEDNVQADQLVISHFNRGGLGFNAHDAHKVLAMAFRGGINPKKLEEATSHELNPLEPKRSEQLALMKQIQARHPEYVAPMTGRERLGTLGCGHFGQAVKATLCECRTPEKSIADARGRLNAAHLTAKDKRFGPLSTTGWRHRIVPWTAIETWPRLANCIQAGLNASNVVSTCTTDSETLVSIVGYTDAMDEPDFAAAAKAVGQTSSCFAYIDKLAVLAEKFSGGPGAPAIRMLHAVSTKLGCTALVGEEVMTAIVEMPHPAESPRPYVRQALLAAQMSSKVVVDGVYRLLKPDHILSLGKDKKHADLVEECEACLSMAHRWVLSANAKGEFISDASCVNVFGNILIRTGLLLGDVCKRGYGPNCAAVVPSDLADVQRKFADAYCAALKPAVPKPKKMNNWLKIEGGDGSGSDPDAEGSEPTRKKHLTFADLTDLTRIAALEGFVEGKCVVQKQGGTDKGVFRITSLSRTACVLVDTETHKATKGEPVTETVAYDMLAKKWKPYTEPVPVVLDTRAYDAPLQEDGPNDDVKQVAAHAVVITQLYDTAVENADSNDAVSWWDPKRIVVNKPLKAKELILVPYTTSNRVLLYSEKGAGKNPVEIVHSGFKFVLTAPACPQLWAKEGAKSELTGMLVPYWHVRPATPHETSNLSEGVLDVTADEMPCGIPCLFNEKALKVGDVLLRPATCKPTVPDDVRSRKAADLGVSSLDTPVPKRPKGAKGAKGASSKGATGKSAGKGKAAGKNT